MFIKILTKTYKGEKRYYDSLVENKRTNGKVVQTYAGMENRMFLSTTARCHWMTSHSP